MVSILKQPGLAKANLGSRTTALANPFLAARVARDVAISDRRKQPRLSRLSWQSFVEDPTYLSGNVAHPLLNQKRLKSNALLGNFLTRGPDTAGQRLYGHAYFVRNRELRQKSQQPTWLRYGRRPFA
jgi:hypothetical protein